MPYNVKGYGGEKTVSFLFKLADTRRACGGCVKRMVLVPSSWCRRSCRSP